MWTISAEGQKSLNLAQSQRLSVSKITLPDAGYYTCVASTAKSAGSATVKVEVLKPSTRYSESTATGRGGHSTSKPITEMDTSTELHVYGDENSVTIKIIFGVLGGVLLLFTISALVVLVVKLVRRKSQKGKLLFVCIIDRWG